MRFSISTTYALASATAALAAPGQVSPRQDAPFQITPIANFAEPWSLAILPDERILVTEKGGRLRLVDPSTSSTNDITGVPAVQYGGQGGLGEVVLHPLFAENSLVYISYAEPNGSPQTGAALARARLVLDSNGGGALEGLEVLWRQSVTYSAQGHFSHRILFSGNSTMWVTSGDRQQFDPAQDLSNNLGKILRLNDDGSVPEGNPFAAEGGVAAQVWAMGIRNPLGIDFDDQGRLWEIEMGPMGGDEFNLIQEGGNYGWPIVSQGDHYDGEPIPDHDTRPEFIPPKAYWVPVISPASMIIYKGDLFPDWTGNAIITGLTSLGLVRVEISGDTAREAERIPMGRRMRCIRQGPDGVLWVLEDGSGGRLLKLTPP
ncbi:Glucose/Sorbosone dehydrogenase [Stachybotrys elegans]|uniref:Glucose/Sorbosone dehydrogenase n=1 Tax=Stachybotrys elegans TaxID=80388 RepID=A0A8K0SIW6_9HYPO|nr:Glucose/Sorbosone dehydrogenase [Stachybotrys elegans]